MQHLAMIMDGNRRWARENKLKTLSLGHKKGMENIKKVVKFCLKKEIKHLSLYAFSLENFKRDEKEKKYLFKILTDSLRNDIDEFIENGVKIRFVGDRTYFPKEVSAIILESEKKTEHLEKLCLNVLFCYGSKQEIVCAVRRIAKKVQDGKLSSHDINEDVLRKEMWLNGTPDPDLIVRTGKKCRLSNFLLFQAAYSEFMFLDCYWPEVDEQCLEKCIDTFYGTQRNFGK